MNFLPIVIGGVIALVFIGVAAALLSFFVFNKPDGEILVKSRILVAENAQAAELLQVPDADSESAETVKQLRDGLKQIKPSGKAAAWETDMQIKELLAAVKSLLDDAAPAAETAPSAVADKLQEILALLPARAKYKK